VGDWIWQITCVSIAAQMSTFALGMLYFHQFPVYFLISNLFVIPLSTIILVVGIFLLLISQVAWLASFTGMMVTYLINALNWIVFEVERWPFSLIEEIHITTFQCWLIMIFLVGIVFLIEFKSFQWIYVSALAVVLILFTQWEHYNQAIDRRQFVVYSVNGHHAMEWIDAGKSYIQADSALMNDAERIRFHIRPNRLNSGVSDISHIIPFSKQFAEGALLYRWQGNTILHWQSAIETPSIQTEVDYLVVSENSFNLDHVNNFTCKTVILDGTNSRFYVNKWKAVAAEKNISVHSVLDMGAFILIQ
jgi:competence protein ComEC